MRRWVGLFCLLLMQVSTLFAADSQLIRIGVLSHRGYEATNQAWGPTATYLSRVVAGHDFEIVPLDFDEMDPAVKFGQVDFILTNPGIYVNLEVRYRVSRIATLNNRAGTLATNVFGGVLFTRSDRDDINTLADIRGHSLMAVDVTSLGGFWMAWREMNGIGLNPYRDTSSFSFGGIHDDVVRAVRDGKVDVGNVRTDILERMAADGEIELDQFKILNPKVNPGFLLSRSTRLYPEWPFSKVLHTSNQLAQKVAVALLNMPQNHPAARAGSYAGWTIPLDYQPVHELFKELHLPPYVHSGRFTLMDAIKKYWYWLVLGLLFVVLMLTMTTWVSRLNRELTKAKQHLERQYELILNSVADGIVGVDLKGNTTFANRAMTRITGWESKDLIGRNQHQLLHHSRADGTPFPAEQCPVYATCQDQISRFVDDDIFWRKDGTSFPVEYSSTPIRNEQFKTVGSVVVFRDISDRKRIHDEAQQHQDDLAHVARLSTMGEMASGIAHEINQPLTAIATNAHACIRMLERDDGERERVIDVMERIGAQAARAGEIIRHLRQFVKKEQPELSLIDINEVINEVILLLRTEIRKAGVKVELDLDDSIGPVLAQHVQIDQVILNLARNAIEAMAEVAEGARVLTVTTGSTDDGCIRVGVSDTGPGIDPAVMGELFNPFVTTKANGMGLGLSISQGIIEAHKGRLQVELEQEQGVTFAFLLPTSQPGELQDE